MTKEERLYRVFGELLYVIAMADGVIQVEEKNSLENLLKNHSSNEAIKWSFNYEVSKVSNAEEIYKKVIDFCHHHGPSPVYNEFIEAMNKISEAAEGIVDEESKLISSFSSDLTTRFQKDLDKQLREL